MAMSGGDGGMGAPSATVTSWSPVPIEPAGIGGSSFARRSQRFETVERHSPGSASPERGGSSRGSRHHAHFGSPSIENPAPPVEDDLHDAFAIGWNEIFDEAPSPKAAVADASNSLSVEASQPNSQQGNSRLRKEGRGAQSPSSTPRLPHLETAIASQATRGAAGAIGSASAADADGGWISQAIFTQRRPPPYLRVARGKQSAIDRGIRERNLNVPISKLRKPAAVIDAELDQLRVELVEDQRRKRLDRRQNRRLARRCRVKGGEDLDELEERYLDSEFLQPLAEIVEPMHGVRDPNVKPLSKEYFASVNHRFGAPRSTWELLPPPPFSYR
jgi:hypothetical protein